MLTIIPAQYGVSLTSREELMPAIRKPSTVTEVPNASCSNANSSGKRQPQQVWDSSSWPLLGSPLAFFCFFFFFTADSCVESVLFSPPGAFPVWLWLFGDVLCLAFFSSFPMPADFWLSRACVCAHADGGASFLPPEKPRFVPAELLLVFESKRLNKYGKHLEADCQSSEMPHIARRRGGCQGGSALPTSRRRLRAQGCARTAPQVRSGTSEQQEFRTAGWGTAGESASPRSRQAGAHGTVAPLCLGCSTMLIPHLK